MGALLKPGEPPIPFMPKDGRVMFTLEELQTVVGGYIEVVAAPLAVVDDGPMYLVLNEDGKRDNLPINGFATALYHQAGGARDDWIVGNVVLASRRELNGDDDEES
jgi:Domain of unknown function (DUF3846)